MTPDHPRSDDSASLIVSWLLALMLAPLALVWCVGEGVRRMIRIFRRVGP